MKSEILENKRVARLDRVHAITSQCTDAIGGESDPMMLAKEIIESFRDWLEAEGGLWTVTSWPTEVAHQDQSTTFLENMLDGRNRHSDASIVDDPAISVEGDVEVHPHQNRPILVRDVFDGLLWHGAPPAAYGNVSSSGRPECPDGSHARNTGHPMNMHDTKPASILIAGPTAGGKTSLSIALARTLPRGGECIIADSMQVYRGMDIGTAKPTLEEQAGIPHHLLDIAEPDEPFNVDHWLARAEEAVTDIQNRNHHPIIVGGTNLYIQSFLSGMMEGPEPDEEIRTRLHALETSELRSELEQVDPASAQRIHANDRRRTIRALEFHRLTGDTISSRQSQWDAEDTRSNTLLLGLNYPAEIINPRINARVRVMMEQGLLDEVQQLHTEGKLGTQAIEALGYRQLVDHLEGHLSLEDAVEQIKIRTRRFAKQQRTWLKRFRAQVGGCWIEASIDDTQVVVNKALEACLEEPLIQST